MDNSNNQLSDNNQKSKKKLFQLDDVDESNLELYEINSLTDNNFYQLFIKETYQKLKVIHSSVLRSFVINISYLKALIAKEPNAKYVKISLVQIPDNFSPMISNPELSDHSKNLYFFFSLANSHVNGSITEHFDLNWNNDTMIQIHKDDVNACVYEFEDITKPTCLRNALLEIIANNTKHIYVDIDKLKNDYFKRPELKDAVYIALVFCQVDEFDPSVIASGLGSLLKDNNKHFGCLWKGVDINNRMIPGAPVYDLNSLCPNICP